jgi:hypothetical protein
MAANLLSFDFIRGRLSAEQLEELAARARTKCFEGHWQPGNTLAFLKGLGDPALANGKGKALMRVLAKSPNGAVDLGLRAAQIRALVEWEDPPQLRRVLSRISFLLAVMGQRENWLLADYAGEAGA